MLVCIYASGVFALAWLILRSGPKPSRFAYPCQQAAFSTASLAFGVPVVSALIGARRRLCAGLRTPAGVSVSALGLVLALGAGAYLSGADSYQGPVLDAPAGYRAEVFHMTDCPQNPVGDRFVGLDHLITLMGRQGLKFYQSVTETLVAGPEGIIAVDDTVVIKINYQWSERGGTNTDLLRGLIRRIVDHPDTFTGEVVVCENAQFAGVQNFDRANNNAQDHSLSPHDVVGEFQLQGYTVSHYDWTARRNAEVGEYSQGDMTDGYVVYPHDPQFNGRVSYPKFRTSHGTYISLQYGLWNPMGGTYDREHLKFINVPVLKSHSIYGVTACVKDYMGVVTGALDTNSHNAIRYGILGAVLGEIQLADLNILDSTWINAIPLNGPGTSYGVATRRDELVASTDPIAADIWSVKNILIPAFIANGYPGPWPGADPDDSGSDFREYLDNSMFQILAAGYDVTNDLTQIDSFEWTKGDFDGDEDVDMDDFGQFAGCFNGPDGGPVEPECEPGDFDGDTDIDCDDWDLFLLAWTGLEDPPQLPLCAGVLETRAQQNCINELNKSFAKVAETQGTEIRKCIEDAARGRLLTQKVEECVRADNRGKVARAESRTVTKAASKCSEPPDFGATDATTVNAAAVDTELALIHDILGPDLDAVIISSDSDRTASKCQQEAAAATRKCLDAKLKEFNRCKKNGLRGRDGPPGAILPIRTVSELELCMGHDPKGKIAQACVTKLDAKIRRKCMGVALLAACPGCGTEDPGELATCLDTFAECQLCLGLNQADALNRECDEFDDGVVNGSCS
jgi:hypothetical protein